MHIIWKNIDSRTIDGLIIQSIPPITKPQMRVESIYIDGKDGDIIEELGYSSYEKEFKIGIKNTSNLENIINYLNGEGELITSEEPNRVYKCKIINSIDYSRILKFREAKVIFHTQPYKFLKNETKTIITEKNSTVVNHGNCLSKPLIKIEGTSDIEFIVNSKVVFSYKFDDDEVVYIDCEEQEAYLDNNLKNSNMNGDFPTLKSGENVITWTGNISKIEILANSRWL